MVPVIYILQSERGKFYVGSTINLEVRYSRHLRHTATATTKTGEWHLFAFRNCNSLEEARKIEKKVKSYKSGNGFKKIIRGDVEGWVIVSQK